MDKRTLVFFLLFSLSLFGVNAFFSYYDQHQNQEWYAQQQIKKNQKMKQLQEDLVQRTASLSAFTAMDLFSDSEGAQFIGKAIEVKDYLLVLSKTANLPEKLFASKEKSTETPVEYQAVHLFGEGKLSLYARDSQAPLTIAAIPELGNYDLQMVVMPLEKTEVAKVVLGEYRDSNLIIPAAKLAKESPEKFGSLIPKENGIAFLKVEESYLPVGVYEREEGVLLRLEDMSDLTPFVSIYSSKTPVTSHGKVEEKFYVLENSYQQLVFSNYGGALVEINLPFQTAENSKSIVKEIAFDREMVENHPQNAYFPSHGYYTAAKNAAKTFDFHPQGQLGGYYPLLRRDLIQKPPYKTIRIKPENYALNIVSEYPEVAELAYEVKQLDEKTIVFEAIQQHRRITKTYSIADDVEAPYCLNLDIKIEGDSRGLWLTTGIPDVEWISGSIAPALKYRVTRNQKSEVENMSLPKDAITISSVDPQWICNSNGFLGMIVDPLTSTGSGLKAIKVSGATVPSRLLEIGQENQRFKAADLPGYTMFLPLKANGGNMHFRIFAGPFAEQVLKTVDTTFADPATGYNPDYISCQSFHGWFSFISEPFAKFLLVLLKFFYGTTGSWALSIVLLTVALRLILYPLNAWSVKSMLSMQQIAPEVTALQEKYKKDPKKLQLEIANLYRERGINPLSGCLPLLIQMPFLIGMFDLLKSTFELRGASFIPGWIDNLAAPDVLFSWNYPIFFIGNEFHLLPILLGLVMFVQQRLSSNLPKDANLLTEQQRQQRAMGNIMTVLFAVMFYNVPSGLNIYWLSSMLLGILQQWWTSKRMQHKAAEAVVTKKAVARK